MEIYYNKDVSITKLIKHNKEKKYEIKKFHKEETTFFGFKIKEGYDFYFIYEDGYHYKSIDECFHSEFTRTYWILEGNIVFYKPYVIVYLSNGDKYEKYFDNDIDMDMYINTLSDKLNKLI